MKWVVGSVAVLVALVAGIALGWVARGRQVPVRGAEVAATYLPPPPTTMATPMPTSSPPVATHAPWVEDAESYSWPAKASADVVAVDPTHYLVRASYIDYVLHNQAELLKSARIVPEVVDGGAHRIRIFGVTPSSMLGRIGIQNGDSIETINGVPLGDPSNALDAYTHLSKSKKIVMALERRGAPVELHYAVVP